MKLDDIRTIAKSHGIKVDHFSKANLIKAIQAKEGNFDCFATAYGGECDQVNRLWREDCFTTAHIVK